MRRHLEDFWGLYLIIGGFLVFVVFVWLMLLADTNQHTANLEKFSNPVLISDIAGCKNYKQYVDRHFIYINDCGHTITQEQKESVTMIPVVIPMGR